MKDIRERFYSKVKIVEGDGCWEWQASLFPTGYGRFRDKGKTRYAHRISWELENNPIPDGMHVCHVCDNPKCVRPNHLFIGTRSDNMKDMIKKGRGNLIFKNMHANGQFLGSLNSKSKLTEDQVLLIRACPNIFGVSALFAREFSVNPKTISHIRRGTNWKHLPEPTEEHIQKAKELFETLKNK